MKSVSKCTVLASLAIIWTTFYCYSSFAEPPVYYYNGRVYAHDTQTILVDSKEYVLAVKCVYQKQIKRNRAFFEDTATARDLRTGDHVSMRINGNVVDQITIEEWKR